MAHFAQIDESGAVTQVIVVHNNELLDESGQESEAKGAEFCRTLFGGTWVQTSYNRNFRKNFAGVGFVFDATRDAFIAPQPFPSWSLNEDTCQWEAPTPYPHDGVPYLWTEESKEWLPVPGQYANQGTGM